MKMVLYTVQLSSHVQGKSQKEAIMKIRQMYWTALKMSWRVWIVFQYVNLNYVPRQVTTVKKNNHMFSAKPKQFYW